MAASKPEFQNKMLKNGVLYASLYYQRRVDINGVGSSVYYWINTDDKANFITYHEKALNGFFESVDEALNNYPEGYISLN